MARTRYASDPGLVARMGATMFLLGLVLTGFVIALYFVLFAYADRHGGASGSSDGFVVIAVLIGAAIAFGGYWWSDKIALSTARAQLVTPQQAPQLHQIIDRICALANMPKPRVAISPMGVPNAFATGRSSKVAVVCVTQGLLQRLDAKELEGVLAHELSHVAHKDVAVMTIASFLGIIAALLVRMGFYAELFGGGGRGRGGNNNNGGGYTALIMLAVMAVGIVTYAVSFLLIRMLSRYRELSADRSGALLTGQPSALASALVKVTGDMARIPTRDLRQAEPLNAFYFTPALSGKSVHNLFSTHPSLEKRLAQLEKISKQLGSSAG